MRRLLGLTPLAATVTAALVLVGLATAPSMFLTLLGPAEIHSLVEGEQSFPMTMTTYTTETLPERQLCTLHTYGRAVLRQPDGSRQARRRRLEPGDHDPVHGFRRHTGQHHGLA